MLRSIKAKLQHGAAYNDFLVAVRDFKTYSGIRAFVMNMVYLLLYLRSLL